ncbi:hypothetical protein [Halostella litorea]|uniref:hypothetical protein n=1 Tax=Halostella litorea TaxID=2528831 RepID=UPI0010919550|nr:hypothetical protein [Halostella litorea]
MSDSGDDSRQGNVQSGQGSGQPQGQPAGTQQGQPSAGQPAPGQAPPVQQDSITDKVKDPVVQEFTKGVSALYAIAGVGLGLLVVVYGFVGSPAILSGAQADAASEVSELGAYYAQQNVNSLAQSVVQLLPIIAVVAAVLVGLYAARTIDADEQTSYVGAGVASFAGSVLMVVLGGYLAGSQVSSLQDAAEEAQTAIGNMNQPPEVVQQVSVFAGAEEYSVQLVDLVINSVAVGVVAAVVAVVTAYAYRNFLAGAA